MITRSVAIPADADSLKLRESGDSLSSRDRTPVSLD
jgi:hypothetical protein